MDFLKEIVKEIGYEYTQLASDIDETEKYVDTGSYIFNGLDSGSIFGGVSGNKITDIATSANWRYSINMEIITEESASTLFKNYGLS